MEVGVCVQELGSMRVCMRVNMYARVLVCACV